MGQDLSQLKYLYRRSPCPECPWRKEVAPGAFPVSAFRRLAATAYDLAIKVFTCHMSTEATPVICAGFLARGAEHNLTVRYAIMRRHINPRLIDVEGVELFESYKAMAIANGVSPRSACLKKCRSQDEE